MERTPAALAMQWSIELEKGLCSKQPGLLKHSRTRTVTIRHLARDRRKSLVAPIAYRNHRNCQPRTTAPQYVVMPSGRLIIPPLKNFEGLISTAVVPQVPPAALSNDDLHFIPCLHSRAAALPASPPPPTRYEQRAALDDGASSMAIGSDDGKLFSPFLFLFFDGDDGSWPATSMAAARRWLLSPTAEQHEAEQPAVVFDGHLFSVTLFRSASKGSM
nr:uncharacterized protein LOC109162867 isoform X1 [Ipomoea batatas]